MDHVLYFVANPSRSALDAARDCLDRIIRRGSPQRRQKVQLSFEQSAARALVKLRGGGADTLVIDARGELGGVEESSSLALLRGLFIEQELPRVLNRNRAWLVVDGDQHGAALAFEAGRLHLGGVIPTSDSSWEAIWERIAQTTGAARGKIAICLAGGGTDGLLYELGVLRALAQFLPEYRIQDIDIICGISAGSILGGLLANGVGPREIEAGLAGHDLRHDLRHDSRIEPLRRADLFDPDFREFGRRAARLSWEVARGRRSPLSALFRLAPAGIFAGARLKGWLQRQFSRPGMVDRFEDLPRRLFIGATDQDTNEHVVFGSADAPQVPLHVAIRASTALAPLYAPEKIGGRYYVDGGLTRTTNMRVAVQEGATLVILIDPLVPVTTNQPGHVAERGGIYVMMQGLNSLINGRFDKAVPTLRAMYPQVAFHLFQPGLDTRRVIAATPMKRFYREQIVDMAFRETTRDVRANRFGSLARDFERHGVKFVDPDDTPSSGNLPEPLLRVVA